MNTRTAAAAISAVLFVFLISGCPGNGSSAVESNDANGNSPKPTSTEALTASPADERSYAELSEEDKLKFVREKAVAFFKELGSTGEDQLPDDAVSQIKTYVDAYTRRADVPQSDSCGTADWFRSDLTSVIGRGAKVAPQINKAFRQAGLAPQIGLYIAMIETEYCPCLQSPTGPLGIFQLTAETGRKFGLETKAGASSKDPDERCDIDKASIAEAKRMSAIIDRLVEESGKGSFGKESGTLEKNSLNTVLLAIGAGNMGADALVEALSGLGADSTTDIWTLIAKKDKMPDVFRGETFKYVPKFIAAAIVGENPANFGIKDTEPLSGIK